MNDKPILPPDFDWVTARSSCSAVKVFELLHLEAKKNVETFNDATQLKWEFAAQNEIFSIVRRESSGVVGVRFMLIDPEIEIEGQGVDVRLTATLTLNDAGECRLRVGKEELDRWQLLRRALEPLLFRATRR